MTRPGDDVWWRRSGSTAGGLKPDPWFSLPRKGSASPGPAGRSAMGCENSNVEQGPAHQSRHRDQPDGATNRKCTESVETVRNHSCGAHPGSAGFPGRTSRRACSSSIARRGLLTSRTGDTGGLGDRRELAPPPGPGSGSEDREQRRVTGSLPARRETAGVHAGGADPYNPALLCANTWQRSLPSLNNSAWGRPRPPRAGRSWPPRSGQDRQRTDVG